jgi:hypothetical protein
MSSTSTIYKHKYGEVERLTYTNYERWNATIQFPLMAIDAWDIVRESGIPLINEFSLLNLY